MQVGLCCALALVVLSLSGCGETTTVDVCPAGQIECGSGCYDLMTAGDNCGACGNVCGGGEVCSGGSCSLTCGGDTATQCGTSCIDTDSNRDHCGGCAGSGGEACGDGEVCSGGACAQSCGGDTPTQCGMSCVDTDENRTHCGGCAGDTGVTCVDGEVCAGGLCVASCGAGLVACDSACTNTDYDPANCGGCAGVDGVVCGMAEACVAGICEPLDTETCDLFEIADTTTVPGWTEVRSDFFIDMGRLANDGSSGAYSNYATFDGSLQNDGCATASVDYGIGNTVKSIGIVLRWNSPDDYVVALIQDNSSAGDFNSMWIYEYPGTVQVEGVPSAGSLGTNPIINADIVGTTITLRVDVDRNGTWDNELSGTTTKTNPGLTGFMGLSFGDPAFIEDFCWGACE